jgi:clan AA aspartic protease
MGHFTVPVTLTSPDDPRQSMLIELLVDTGSTYMLLPPEVVAALGLRISEERPGELASGERIRYGVGEVRVTLDDRQFPSIFVAGPAGCPALLGAVTLEEFGLGVDPVHRRLVPVVARI